MTTKVKELLLASIVAFAISPLFVSCSNDENNVDNNKQEEYVTGEDVSLYPKADNSAALTGSEALRMNTALAILGDPKNALNLGETKITDSQLSEIKTFTDNLVKDCSTAAEKYSAIFKWIKSNISYEFSDNEAYTVFKTRKAICQGYSNILKVMLFTQDIPAINVYGYLGAYGAHAWVYCYTDKWIVSDPTNGADYDTKNVASYKDALIPTIADIVIAEDDHFEYSYYEKRLTATKVKEGAGETLVVPYSVNGYTVASFNPRSPLPSDVKNLYLGKNIISIGIEDIGLCKNASNLENVYVQSTNTAMENHKGTIYALSSYNNESSYSKSGNILFIPPMIHVVELKPTPTIGKNVITNHEGIRKLIVPNGVKTIEAYAIENCPNLVEAVVPASTTVAEFAFYGVSDTFTLTRR